jgi:DNA-binding GntR family transcriptional regulator
MVQRNLTDADSHRGTGQGHRELLQALWAGDEAGAVAVLEHHLRKQYRWIVNRFGETDHATPG